MKILKCTIIFLLIFSLTSCGKSEFSDLSGFITEYNEFAEGNNLSITDFSFEENEKEIKYTSFISSGNKIILLSLNSEKESPIHTLRVFISKIDENGKKKALTQEEFFAFSEVFASSCASFCNFEKSEVDRIISALFPQNFNEKNEIIYDTSGYNFLYYSNDLSSEAVITNIFLKNPQNREKPESRPYFADSENTREYGATTGKVF